MENIDTLFKMQRQHYSAAQAYDYFCEEVENCLPYVFGLTHTIRDLAADAGEEKLLLRSTIIAAVNKMFLDCAFAVMHQEQALCRTSWRIWRKTCKRKSHAFAWLFCLSVRFRCPAIPRGWRP